MARRLLVAAALALAALTTALGVWQLERRQWKLALIAQVEARLAAPPVPAPGPARWGAIGARDAYTRVTAQGIWRDVAPAFVQAVTDFGGGFWVMAPLDTPHGTILVNRGFVPADARARLPRAAGPAAVTGLLRVSEPGGGFLRSNDPAADRWYSRDVAAIARARRLGTTAPYFIDAAAAPSAVPAATAPASAAPAWPRGGLTVVRFRNTHLVYALTWFALAGLAAFLAWRVARTPPAA